MKIAFLGLGAMGVRMVEHLLKAGHDVTVWNRTSEKMAALVEKGAAKAESPKVAAAGKDAVFSMVRDDEASQRVWLDEASGAIHGMSAGSVAVECSTLSLAGVQTLAQAFRVQGRALVDAPLSGSRPQAEAATLVFFAGGDNDAVAKVTPLLNTMGSAVHHAGPVGSGVAIKLAVNAMLATQVATMAELYKFLQAQDLPVPGALEMMASSPVFSPAANLAGQSMANSNFAPLFPVELVAKDLDYFQRSSPNAAVISQVKQTFDAALAAGFGDEQMTAVVKLDR
ncbi:NAD(P)-dependent oxidoreductase [Teredinibacter turnerae]|uniref:NAD(P)-dependent oxidoreductase n=1 Tax=Teredinibacter turnerae TaxID=2426 RepID=UPI0003790512|nr:NAD(P)-dependent oxidoreductase [Teredinibacter turnerae]